ncbi:mitosis protein DIM1-domain-containing protein [Cunninghamella echinulata]|nr:mitosis protein DIM1-domain-containing protein [Cunninghamella echinulata]
MPLKVKYTKWPLFIIILCFKKKKTNKKNGRIKKKKKGCFFLFFSSIFVPCLPSNEHIEAAINSEEDHVVVIRFGLTGEQNCFTMDETLDAIARAIQQFAAIYKIYGLDDDPITVLFFYKDDKQKMVDIIETVYRGASNNQPVITSVDAEY